MPSSLFQYEMLPTTWFYLSSLMLVAIFFRFNRFFSIRNADIVGMILFTPGLLYIAMGVNAGSTYSPMGYLWLMVLGFFAFMRMVLDSFMVRRPLLEPNLTALSTAFACITLVIFMTANVFVNRGGQVTSTGILRLEQLLTMEQEYSKPPISFQTRPGYSPFLALTNTLNRFQVPSETFWKNAVLSRSIPPMNLATSPLVNQRTNQQERSSTYSTNHSGRSDSSPANSPDVDFPVDSGDLHPEGMFLLLIALLIQVMIVLCLVLIGHCHFGNIKTGVAAAFFYLLHPYVMQITCMLDHSLPALLLLLAVLFYRRPFFSGMLVGTAGSLVFYPFFLIPLWGSFYYQRGAFRFLLGTLSSVLAMGILLLLSPETMGTYAQQIAWMFGMYSIKVPVYEGLWLFCPTVYRIPIIAFFGVFCFGLLLWPTRKNLATLISCSALLMLGVQFWMGYQGGLYMAWYLPLMILTIFRPNLEDRVAMSTVVEIYT